MGGRVFIAGTDVVEMKLTLRMELIKEHPCEQCGTPTKNKHYCKRTCFREARAEAVKEKWEKFFKEKPYEVEMKFIKPNDDMKKQLYELKKPDESDSPGRTKN